MAITPESEIVAGIGNDYKYGFHDEENYVFKSERGLSADVVRAISERKAERPEGSYVVSLLDAGVARCAQKVGEEAVETGLAAVSGDREALVSEAADLVFHLYVLLAAAEVDVADVEDELARRAH